MRHDHWNDRIPATRCATGINPVAVSLANAPPTALICDGPVIGQVGSVLTGRSHLGAVDDSSSLDDRHGPIAASSTPGAVGMLRARRVIFAKPAARRHLGKFERTIPLPIDLARLQPAFTLDHPPTAPVAALMIYHGLRPSDVTALKLTDVCDGRLHIGDRTVLMPTKCGHGWARSRARTEGRGAAPEAHVLHNATDGHGVYTSEHGTADSIT